MPIYEYQCKKCGEFETTQRITAPPLTRCPTCRGKVTKLISSTSFHLKGSGWYVTDYARKEGKGKDTGKSESDAGNKSESKTESKSESKADTKSESKTEKGGGSKTKSSKSTEAAAA